MGESLKKFQDLIRNLFELDFADLDFGLYRLFHLKRSEIETFITEQLPREVDAAFAEVSNDDREQLQEELDKLAQEIRKNISEDAIQPDGSIAENYRSIKLCQRYEDIRTTLSKLQVTEGHKAEVFNHLINFFSRYYEDGDFIPKRRYGARETYSVPYNGEEVFFHWANRDQHYVKTAERFRDYAFKVQDLTGEYRVRFTMTKASIPKDNTKGKTRYFFPRPELATYDAEAREFVLPFEYRLPTPGEAEQYGSNHKAQEAILEAVLPNILEIVPDANLRALLSQSVDESKEVPSVLQKRLYHFCRRNTSDYFIHKDLRSFLTRELEFYIKDQVIHLMDLEGDLDAKRRVVRTFRKLAGKVIDFLATIEDAQKTLFEKKKFVLETDYLIPILHVPREFWPEILVNQAQLVEWRHWLVLEPQNDLFNQEGTINEAFLEAHPTLPLHTKHFDRDFVRRLLEALPFEDLDEATDGLLVHGENYQALRLLMERYREQVKCIYIDPPYNTDDVPIIYKNGYKHSTWLALIDGRLHLAAKFLCRNGILEVAIDDAEQAHLANFLDYAFPMRERVTFVINHHPQGSPKHNISRTHEYLLVLVPKGLDILRLPREEDSVSERPFMRTGTANNNFRIGRPNSFYAVLVDTREKKVVGVEPPPNGVYPVEPNPEGYFRVYPIDSNGAERVWRKTYQRAIRMIEQGDLTVRIRDNGKITVYEKANVKLTKPVSNWVGSCYNAGPHGTNLLTDVLGENLFSYPKSINAVSDAVQMATYDEPDQCIVFDFFAGSGTTGHAVINLNREDDDGWRKFILVEMGEYFDTVLLPRIVKVMYTPEWKDGKPKREATPEEAERTPRLVKILRLESYEDALHNLVASSTLERAAEYEAAYKVLAGEDAYRLRYWIELPLREAETCLRTVDLNHPFAYSMEILTDDGPVRKPVDVVETFNYLYGLRVRRYETWRNPTDNDREYRVVKAIDREGKRRILVLWRDMTGHDPESERTFLEGKIAEMKAQGEVWDEILINGDSPTQSVTSLDPLFKRLMIRGEE